jgi:hypothetical protein
MWVQLSDYAEQPSLKSKRHKKVVPGYEVDHMVPQSMGWYDTPSHMQLIPKRTQKQKTAGGDKEKVISGQ